MRDVLRGIALTFLLVLALAGAAHARTPGPLRPCGERVQEPLSVIQFFDWYSPGTNNTSHWTHKVDWAREGLADEDVGVSAAYYDSQLAQVRALGVDGIVYEYAEDGSRFGWRLLTPAFLASLRAHGVKVGLFYDLELEQVATIGPVLSEDPYIRPSEAAASVLVEKLAGFYERVPRESWLVDHRGRLPMMVYGFGFDDTVTDAPAWARFYAALLRGLEDRLGIEPVLYWSAINRLPLELAFQRFPQQIRPFNFVLDNPQPQLAPGAVTWNVNFDNLGVQRRYGLLRVVRDDPRYLQEMLWLAKRTAPELLFIYGWNEFYEGANVMPDLTYGRSRYELLQALLADVGRDHVARLPCTLLVVDDYSTYWRNGDWHLLVEEQLTLYPMRRLAPQADVVLAREVTAELLDRYDLIVVLAQRSRRAIALAAQAMGRKRVAFLGPATAASRTAVRRFAKRIRRVTSNREVQLLGAGGRLEGTLFVHDDVFDLTPEAGVSVLLSISAGRRSAPVLLRRGDDWWLNAYSPDSRLLAPLFAGLYGRRLEAGIMYGEGFRSQRLEVFPDGRVVQNTFSAPVAFQHDPLPVPWRSPPPQEVPAS